MRGQVPLGLGGWAGSWGRPAGQVTARSAEPGSGGGAALRPGASPGLEPSEHSRQPLRLPAGPGSAPHPRGSRGAELAGTRGLQLSQQVEPYPTGSRAPIRMAVGGWSRGPGGNTTPMAGLGAALSPLPHVIGLCTPCSHPHRVWHVGRGFPRLCLTPGALTCWPGVLGISSLSGPGGLSPLWRAGPLALRPAAKGLMPCVFWGAGLGGA